MTFVFLAGVAATQERPNVPPQAPLPQLDDTPHASEPSPTPPQPQTPPSAAPAPVAQHASPPAKANIAAKPAAPAPKRRPDPPARVTPPPLAPAEATPPPAPPSAATAPPPAPVSADAGDGAALVARRCAPCHQLEAGKAAIGPSLAGIVGRRAGTQPGYAYSAGLAHWRQIWTPERLDSFLANPIAVVKGTKMQYPGISDQSERQAIIAYLASLNG